MREELKPILQMYKLNANLFGRALSGISPKDLNRRITGSTNSIAFIAGHLAETRAFVAGMLGIQNAVPWKENLFGTLDENAQYPDIETITGFYTQSHEKLMSGLPGLTEKDLAAEPPTRVPFEEHTMMSAVSFFAYHEAYHVGQLNVLRKALGYESIFK